MIEDENPYLPFDEGRLSPDHYKDKKLTRLYK